MKVEEAIDILLKLNIRLDEETINSYKAIKIATESIEKQIPKKVIFCKNLMTKETSVICPACQRIIESTNFHCWNCGQKLDWSEEE